MRAALVLDFDNTLAVTMVSEVTRPVHNFGSDARIKMISQFLEHLTRRGVHVYILSGNHEDIIRASLFHAGISDRFFWAIYGGHAADKYLILNDLLETYEKVVFVDDYPGSFKGVNRRVTQIFLNNGPIDKGKMDEIKSRLGLDDADVGSYSCAAAVDQVKGIAAGVSRVKVTVSRE